jgi:histidine ammonia-lyase
VVTSTLNPGFAADMIALALAEIGAIAQRRVA